jgi:RNA polymerase sigma-70 factor (ECF subfamily)
VVRLEQVFQASYRRLVGQLYGVCGDLGEAEDVVAEAFVRAADRQRTFDRVDNPEAWLRTVAVNLARSRFRRRQVARRFAHEQVPEPTHAELSPERVAVVEALRRLPHDLRDPVALHYLADLPLHQVAATLDVPLGTVKSRLSRGRRELALLLDDALTPRDSDV